MMTSSCRPRALFQPRLLQTLISLETPLIRRPYSSTSTSQGTAGAILSKPTWSVKSLLPEVQNGETKPIPSVTPKQLRHLLRLSALPQPSSQVEEEDMLRTLESQIHFVKEVQQVDTTDVTPLRSIRDESEVAQKENTIGLSTLKEGLEREQYVGRIKRIRRVRAEKLEKPDGETWNGDALQAAKKTMGKYFVVQGGSG